MCPCGQPFEAYIKSKGVHCSHECGRKTAGDKQRGKYRNSVERHCANCGISFYAPVSEVEKGKARGHETAKYCSKKCQFAAYKGEGNPKWRGGRYKTAQGHVLVYCPDHPNQVKGMVMEHRLVMEAHIGRYLTREEVVHHINEIKDDNRIENLQLCANASEHRKAHGHYQPYNCEECGKDIQRSEGQRKNGKGIFCSIQCAAAANGRIASSKFVKREYPCTRCGVTVIKTDAQRKRYNNVFCGKRCGALYNLERINKSA